MSERNYRIKYRKDDFEVDVQGDKEWVEQKFKELTERKAVAPKEVPTKTELVSMSLAEFVRTKGNPSRNTDRAIIFSYWLHHRENVTSYNINDIRKCYSDARITPPNNLTDTMNLNQGKGYLMHVSEKKDGKKTWVITQTGEEYVEQMR